MNRNARQYLCADAVLCMLIEILVIISVQRRRSACDRNSCHHLCAEVVLSICIDMFVSISVQRRRSVFG